MSNDHSRLIIDASNTYMDEIQRISSTCISRDEGNIDVLADLVEKGINGMRDGALRDRPGQTTQVWPALQEQGVDPQQAMQESLRIISGQLKWHDPNTVHNILPSPLLNSVASLCIASALNGNGLWDFLSGHSLQLEQHVVQQMACWAGMQSDKAGGAFTFGGRGCVTYAIRMGINRCVSGASTKGLSIDTMPAVFTGKVNHYSVEHACSLLGLGKGAAVRIDNDSEGRFDLNHFRTELRKAFTEGRGVAAIVASGGNAMDVALDPLREMQQVIDEEVAAASVPYRPFVFFDTVVGWAWMSFFDYDFTSNPLSLPDPELAAISRMVDTLRAISTADAFGCDFHKTSMAPTVSSCFIARDGNEYRSIMKDEVTTQPWQPHGNNFVHPHTIEHTRPVGPIAAAWTSLRTLGKAGLRSYLARLMELSRLYKQELARVGFEIVDTKTTGFSTTIYPASLADAPTYDELIELPAGDVAESNRFVFRLFDNLAYPDDDHPPVVPRYLPQARTSKSGALAGALVIYPMSIHTTNDDVKRISERISSVYRTLLAGGGRQELRFAPPLHTPR